jgi:pSer/pThr/pTyr-binding forkhead associated (FHA) protein
MKWTDPFQQKLGQLGHWYQRHFSVPEDSELTPKDVLGKIIEAMEEFRTEGVDGRIYVPNKYILELAVMNPEERAYLLSFLDEQELSACLENYLAHKNYLTRGQLDFTIEEMEAFPGQEKLYVRALFEKSARKVTEPIADQTMVAQRAKEPSEDSDEPMTDMPTVEARSAEVSDEPATIHAGPSAWAALLIEGPDGNRSLVSITKPVFFAGRSRHAGNDLVLAEDGQVSKRHIRIERELDGGATLYDLASTNGTYVNGQIVPVNVALKNGAIIEIGQTKIEFKSGIAAPGSRGDTASGAAAQPDPNAQQAPRQGRKVARLVRPSDNSEHILGSETLIGRSMTCDVVLSEPTVSSQQARIQASGSLQFAIQDLSGRGTTIINGRPVRTGERLAIGVGDRITLGGVAFVFKIE